MLSRRAVLEDERKEMRQAILDRLSPGDVIEGQISNIVDFGAFVDLDGMDGLIHISELSWSHVNHPSEVLDIGQTVKVKVLDIDRDRQRISLGLKQTQSDPWQQVLDSLPRGRRRRGPRGEGRHVRRLRRDPPRRRGPRAHLRARARITSRTRARSSRRAQAVNVRILEIDGDRRRLSLSLKRVEEGEQPVPRADGAESVHTMPDLRLSEEAFPSGAAAATVEDGRSTQRSRAEAAEEAAEEVAAEAAELRGGGRAEAEAEFEAEAEAAEPEPETERRARADERRARAEAVAEASSPTDAEAADEAEPTPETEPAVEAGTSSPSPTTHRLAT